MIRRHLPAQGVGDLGGKSKTKFIIVNKMMTLLNFYAVTAALAVNILISYAHASNKEEDKAASSASNEISSHQSNFYLYLIILSLLFILAVVIGLFVLFYPIISASFKSALSISPEEMCFPAVSSQDSDVWIWKSFNSILESPSKSLSVIVPAYNEEKRIGVMLDEAIGYLLDRQKSENDEKFTFEIIVVDDGSKDGTSAVVMKYVKKYGTDTIRLLTLQNNCGKGGAVQRGMLRARGEYLLMVDADGATKFSDLERLERGITRIENGSKGSASIAVGSRAHMDLAKDASSGSRHPLRSFVSKVFHILVTVFIGTSVIDTQCGFKLFSRKAALLLFSNQHIQRWAFDIELLYLAHVFKIPVAEEAVKWEEVPGSKLNVVTASIQMIRDIVLIRLCYAIGLWRMKVR